MIRVWTRAGHLTFEDADAYSISPIPQPPVPSNTLTAVSMTYQVPDTLPGSLKIWRVSPDPEVNQHEMLAWFAPGGWIGLDFRESEPHAMQIKEPIGFQGPKREGAAGN
jgi:hypothetical protein